MAVIISIPFESDWMVSNAAFRLLAQRAKEQLVLEDDKHELDVAAAMGGLFLDLKDGEVAQRLAIALTRGAAVLRREMSVRLSEDPWDREFAERLDVLAMLLTELRGDGLS